MTTKQDERAVDLLTGRMQCEVNSGRTAPRPDPRLRGALSFVDRVNGNDPIYGVPMYSM